MEFKKESFEKALKANRIVRYQKHFEAVVKSYLEAESEQCKYVKREGESCTLNDNCTYPNCKE